MSGTQTVAKGGDVDAIATVQRNTDGRQDVADSNSFPCSVMVFSCSWEAFFPQVMNMREGCGQLTVRDQLIVLGAMFGRECIEGIHNATTKRAIWPRDWA